MLGFLANQQKASGWAPLLLDRLAFSSGLSRTSVSCGQWETLSELCDTVLLIGPSHQHTQPNAEPTHLSEPRLAHRDLPLHDAALALNDTQPACRKSRLGMVLLGGCPAFPVTRSPDFRLITPIPRQPDFLLINPMLV